MWLRCKPVRLTGTHTHTHLIRNAHATYTAHTDTQRLQTHVHTCVQTPLPSAHKDTLAQQHARTQSWGKEANNTGKVADLLLSERGLLVSCCPRIHLGCEVVDDGPEKEKHPPQ